MCSNEKTAFPHKTGFTPFFIDEIPFLLYIIVNNIYGEIKMKKILCFLLLLALVFPVAACKENTETSQNVSEEESAVKVEPQKNIDITTSAGKITVSAENVNADTISAEGFYLYTDDYAGAVTPDTSLQRMDFTIVETHVAAVWDKNTRSFIPDQNGATVVCVGADAVSYAESIQAGYEVKTENLSFTHLSAYYAVVGETVINISFSDMIRQPEGVCVLYTPEYGSTTGTNVYGMELTVVDGKVTAVSIGRGNSAIPENGYVISIHKDHEAYYSAVRLKVGDPVVLFPDGPAYYVSVIDYDAVNGSRGENQVILYKNVASTGTNMYGYEIAVNKDGVSVADSYTGDISVPEGGFAVSAHGDAIGALEDAYARGQTVKLIAAVKQVIIIKTPTLCINAASDSLESALASYEEAKKNCLNIDYSGNSAFAQELEAALDEAKQLISAGDLSSAREKCTYVTEQAETLLYLNMESRTAQNRAMWYRAAEKSDDEVRATVEKLVSLNVNALYLETFYDGCFAGYLDIDGLEHTAINGDYDVLEGFVRIGHEYGIEVHAWCENFFAGYLKDGTFTSAVLEKFKDKLLLDSNGNNFYYYHETASFVFLNPNDRDCRDYVLEVYRQMIQKYDIDGLHLDYIRFPEYNYGKYDYGYNEDIISAFAAQTGITKDPRTFTQGSSDWQAWVDFRCGIISSFVGEVFDMVCATDPDTWLSCAVYPDRINAVKTIFQDVKTWVDNCWIDEVFSMSYSGDTEYVYENASGYADICKNKCFYSTGLAAFMDVSQKNFATELSSVFSAGADGAAVFALVNIMPGTYQTQITSGAFREPSVQLYLCGDTVKAQLGFISSLLGNSEILFPELTDENKQTILAEIDSICASASSPLSSSEKISYCRNTVKQLNALKTTVETAFPEGSACINEEIDYLISWLEITADRTEAKN